MRRIYIAGPDVFYPDAPALAAAKCAACVAQGFHPLHPIDQPVLDGPAIYARNQALMHEADAIVANLSPFRGPSADPGTVFEFATLLALGRPAFAYSLAPGDYFARVAEDGMLVEDFGLPDNLMIACAAPWVILDRPRENAHLWCFERCLEAAHRHFEALP